MATRRQGKQRLSKSRLISSLQCHKRLWLETHRPDAAALSPAIQQSFASGHQVGDLARKLAGKGVLIESQQDLGTALDETAAQVRGGAKRLFEATFRHEAVLVRADILERGRKGFHLREVKASGSLKEHHLRDAAIQAWVLHGAGVPLESVHVQHLDTGFVYPGGEDYDGLFVEHRVDKDIRPLLAEVPQWVDTALSVLAAPEPEIRTGKHCSEPYGCPFLDYCSAQEPQAEYPLNMLPYMGKLLPDLVAEGYRDVRDIPPGRLANEKQERVRRITRSGKPELAPKAKAAMRALPYPRYYFDFETVGFAVPQWPGTKPYQQVPFQWSCHIERAPGKLEHRAHLDTSGTSPAQGMAETLLDALGDSGPILAHNAGFERRCIEDLARSLPKRAAALRRVAERLVDTLSLARDYYYHPAMKGSWSLKAIVPAIAPELDYGDLGEVQDGGAASAAYTEIVAPDTPPQRKAELRASLERYCARDTLALVRLVKLLQTGR